MAFNCKQFRDLIEKILVLYPELYSTAAVNLLLGTAAQESLFGTYLRQISGPALGVFQTEPKTYEWLCSKYFRDYQYLLGRPATDLVWDLKLAILIARLRYRAVREPLPPSGDIKALAQYWKQHYNTYIGGGTVDEFITNYKKYVED